MTRATGLGRAWTGADLATLTRLRAEGHTVAAIAEVLGCKEKRVRDKLEALGIPKGAAAPPRRAKLGTPFHRPAPGTTTPRRCLCCLKDFPSEGPGNRLCVPCKRYGTDFMTAGIPGLGGRVGKRAGA